MGALIAIVKIKNSWSLTVTAVLPPGKKSGGTGRSARAGFGAPDPGLGGAVHTSALEADPSGANTNFQNICPVCKCACCLVPTYI